jgi:hypothetical protein
MTLSNAEGRLGSWDLPMGYTMEGYPVYGSDRWKQGEIFVGRYGINLLPELKEGTYDLGFSIRSRHGASIPAGGHLGDLAIASGAIVGGRDGAAARFANGEILFENAVTVVGKEEVDQYAEKDRLAALESANKGDCEEAEDLWILARRHVPLHEYYRRRNRPEMGEALSICWARRSEIEVDSATVFLAKARAWNHRNETFRRIRKPVVDELYAEGIAAREAEDWQTAFERFNTVLTIDASRSWARRYTEEARDHRLGLPLPPPPTASEPVLRAPEDG